MGDTNIEATIKTFVLVARPPAAMSEAPDMREDSRKLRADKYIVNTTY